MLKKWLLKLLGIDEETFDAVMEFINLLIKLFGSKDEAVRWVKSVKLKLRQVGAESARDKLKKFEAEL